VERHVNTLEITPTGQCTVEKNGAGNWSWSGEQFVAGELIWEQALPGGNVEARSLTILAAADTGNTMVIHVNRFLKLPELSEISLVRVVKGCAHTEQACIDWHGNLGNYGGQIRTPLKSPINKVSEYY
jgi:hypothetical protein